MGKNAGEPIDDSGWPVRGAHRVWLEFCRKLHSENGLLSRRVLAEAMGLTSPTRINDILRGRKWPADYAQAEKLMIALGGVGSEIDGGMRLYEAACRERPPSRRRRTSDTADGEAPAWWQRSGYVEQVRNIAPQELLERQAELRELESWCAGDELYAWWQAPARAGKSAMMAWFVLHPPPNFWVISFFVTARLAGQDDSVAYTAALLDQFAAITGDDPPTAELNRTLDRDRLMRRAAEIAAAAGKRLVLVVDGLDEDRGTRLGSRVASIAASLPKRPIDGLRIIVAGRPDPPAPKDIDIDHPLRSCRVRRLTASPHARRVVELAQRELDDVFAGEPSGDRLSHDVLGLVAASGGGLAGKDLEDLTGRPPFELDGLLRGVFGRTVAGRPDQLSTQQVYLFTHETLSAEAINRLGPALLDKYRAKIHAWADRYRAEGWPRATPSYLLRGYFGMLRAAGDLRRMGDYATDSGRHDRMLDVLQGDHEALAEIASLQEHLLAQPDPDLTMISCVAVHRVALTGRNMNIPAELPIVFAKLGDHVRAVALARSIADPQRRAEGQAGVANALAEAGKLAAAEGLVAEIGPWVTRAWALLSIATTSPDREHELLVRAYQLIKEGASTGKPNYLLAIVVEKLAAIGDYDAATSATALISDVSLRMQAVGHVVAAAYMTGDIIRAETLIASAEAGPQRERVRAVLAESAAAVGQEDLPESIVAELAKSRLRDWVTARVSRALAHAGKADRAEALAATLGDGDMEAWAFAEIAKALAAGDTEHADRAATCAHRAEALIRNSHNHPMRAGILVDIASALSQVNRDLAYAVANQVQMTVLPFGDSVENVLRLAEFYASVGELDRATRLILNVQNVEWPRGIRSAHGVVTEHVRQGLVRVARRAAATGDVEGAIAIQQSSPALHARILAAVADQILTHNPTRAAELAHQAEGRARSVEIARQRDGALENLALNLSSSNTELARSAAEAIPILGTRGQALANLARRLIINGNPEEGLDVARSLPDLPNRVEAMASISALLCAYSDSPSAAEFVRDVEKLSSSVTDKQEHAKILGHLARALAKENPKRALQLLFKIQDQKRPELNVLSAVVNAIASMGTTRAEATLHNLIPDQWKPLALRELALSQARAGQADEALNLVECLPEDIVGASTRADLAVALAEGGKADHAEQIADSITDRRIAAPALLAVVRHLIAAGETDQAETTAKKITEVRHLCLAAIDLARAVAYDKVRCLDAIRQAEYLVLACAPPREKVTLLIALAHTAVKASEPARTSELIDEARSAVAAIEDTRSQAHARTDLARALSAMGDHLAAEAEVALTPPGDLRSKALADLSMHAPLRRRRALLTQAFATGNWHHSLPALAKTDSAALAALAREVLRLVTAGRPICPGERADWMHDLLDRGSPASQTWQKVN
jgi:hypothetical protein